MLQDWTFGGEGEKLSWPLTENGEKEKAVCLTGAEDTLGDADVKLSMLTAYGIPCFKYYAKEGGAGKVINGFSGFGADIYVPASRLEEAKALLEAEPIFPDEP